MYVYSSCHPLNLRWQSYHDTALNDTPRNIYDFAKLRGNQRIGYRQKTSENLNTQFAKTKKLQHFEDEYSSAIIRVYFLLPKKKHCYITKFSVTDHQPNSLKYYPLVARSPGTREVIFHFRQSPRFFTVGSEILPPLVARSPHTRGGVITNISRG